LLAVRSRLRRFFSIAALLFLENWASPCGMSIDLEELDRFTSHTVNVGAKISPLTLNLPAWCEAFEHDSDAPFLIGGCAYGFNWEKAPPVSRFVNRNHVEEEYSAQVDANIRGMVAKGELVRAHPSAIYCVSGILAIPKDAGDDVRVCHNLAAPFGDSVNDNQWVPSMRFISVMDALALTRAGGWMFKVDISAAYRHMACHPSFWPLHALQWPSESGEFYCDTRLPFGSKGAVACFQRFSNALGRYVARRIPLAP
jgi:hypothetical protein